MEKEKPSEGLSDDTVAGALARREKFLGNKTISDLEEMRIFSSMQHVRKLSAENPNVHEMTRERAIDKLTAEALFRQHYPAWKGVQAIIALATEDTSFDDGLVVYRLPSRDWLEPIFGHYIPKCFPWAQLLEQELQQRIEQQIKDQGTGEETPPTHALTLQTGSVAKEIAKTLGSER